MLTSGCSQYLISIFNQDTSYMRRAGILKSKSPQHQEIPHTFAILQIYVGVQSMTFMNTLCVYRQPSSENFLFYVFRVFFFFFKQKTAYEIGTGDWSSDVCSSDLIYTSTNICMCIVKKHSSQQSTSVFQRYCLLNPISKKLS